MPPRVPPKTYILLLKTHRLTVFLSAPQNATVGSLKAEALSALSSPVLRERTDSDPVPDRIPTAPGEDEEMFDVHGSANANVNEDIPAVTSVDDFELCRAIKDRGRQNAAAPAYEVLDPDSPIRGLLNNWEELYVQFRDENGELVPVEVSHTSLLDEEEEEQARRAPPPPLPPQPTTPMGKGKRKAPPE
ncbi:hypothetical protein BKA83DRAFT_518365 [Pisolithus microcarpus]|nr:hypothetical protein BKA83DRAFT_518365 [Pisolithus microcarpus]